MFIGTFSNNSIFQKAVKIAFYIRYYDRQSVLVSEITLAKLGDFS